MTMITEGDLGYEAKYALDKAFRFRANARRDQLFASWAANRLGLSAAARVELTAAIQAVPDGPGGRLIATMVELFASNHCVVAQAELTGALETCELQTRMQLTAALASIPDHNVAARDVRSRNGSGFAPAH